MNREADSSPSREPGGTLSSLARNRTQTAETNATPAPGHDEAAEATILTPYAAVSGQVRAVDALLLFRQRRIHWVSWSTHQQLANPTRVFLSITLLVPWEAQDRKSVV